MKKIFALFILTLAADVAAAQYAQPVQIRTRVDSGCYGRSEQIFVTNFRKISDSYQYSVYQGLGQARHRCSGDGYVQAVVTIQMPRYQDRVDYQGYLLGPIPRQTDIRCAGSSSWSSNTYCELQEQYYPEPPPTTPNPQYPPHRPPGGGGHYPPPGGGHQPPPAQGNALVVKTEVEVGCRGRVAPVEVTNLTLVSQSGGEMLFRGYNRVAHKCGDSKKIAATVEVSIHRSRARVNARGVLLSPAVNADVRCYGESDWIGTSNCRVVSQQ